MKKLIKLILCTAILDVALSLTGFAKTGDIIGYAKYTDISAYINHYPITSYNINGNTAVIAEDLANYGFDVVWDGNARTLTVTRGNATSITPYGNVYKHSDKVGQNSFPIYSTDIVTYVNNDPVTSFAIGGKTCIYIDSLAPYGELGWIPEQRATKLWISGLPTAEYKVLKEAPDGTRQKPYNLGDTVTVNIYKIFASDPKVTFEITPKKMIDATENKKYLNCDISLDYYEIDSAYDFNDMIIYEQKFVTSSGKNITTWGIDKNTEYYSNLSLFAGDSSEGYISVDTSELAEGETIDYFAITTYAGYTGSYESINQQKTVWFSLK